MVITNETLLFLFLSSLTFALLYLKHELNMFRKDVDKILTAFSIIARTKANGTGIFITNKEHRDEDRTTNKRV